MTTRKKGRENKVIGNFSDIFKSINEKLDFKIRDSHERCKIVNELFPNETKIGITKEAVEKMKFNDVFNALENKLNDFPELKWIIEYISSESFAQVKLKGKPLSEDIFFHKQLEKIADYILFYDFKNYNILPKRRLWTIYRREHYFQHDEQHDLDEKLDAYDLISVLGNHALIDAIIAWKKHNMQQAIYKRQRHIIDSDVQKYPELNSFKEILDYLYSLLGYGILDKEKIKAHKEWLNGKFKYGEIKKLKRLYGQTLYDAYIAKEQLRKPVTPKNVSKTHVRYNFNDIDLSSPEHVYALLKHYFEIKNIYEYDVNSTVWTLLYTLDETINKINLTDEEKYIIDIVKQEIPQKEPLNTTDLTYTKMAKMFSNRFGTKKTYEFVKSQLKFIAEKVAFKCKLEKEKYLYRNNLKTCAKCKQEKPPTIDYFTRKDDTKDGLHPYCKNCRRKQKNKNNCVA